MSYCVQCKLGGSYWTYETTSGMYCPYGSKCKNNCYKCISDPASTFCSNSFLSICPNHPVIFIKTHCKSSYIKSDSGSYSLIVPSQILCYVEIDIRDYNEKSSIIEFSFDSISSVINTKENQQIFILVFTIEDSSVIVDLKTRKGLLRLVSSEKIKVKGNYFVVGKWSKEINTTNYEFSWEKQENYEKKIDYKIIIAALVPSFILSLCIMCLFSYYKKKRLARSLRISYQIVVKSELMDESFIECHFPSKYFLLKEDEVCPICFEYFKLGNEVRYTHCNHSFHASCFDDWILSKPAHYVCPICKSELFEPSPIDPQ